jgi:hypothetical protein
MKKFKIVNKLIKFSSSSNNNNNKKIRKRTYKIIMIIIDERVYSILLDKSIIKLINDVI